VASRSGVSSSLSAIALLAVIIVAGAQRAVAADTIQIGGTGSALGSMTMIAEAYMRAHPDRTVVVLPSLGIMGGMRALRTGIIAICLSADPLSPDEKADGLVSVPYAKSALGFATRPDTPVEGVTADWLADVYRGTITRWPNGTPIRLVLRPAHDSDTRIASSYSEPMRQAIAAALERPGLLIEDTAQSATRQLARLEGSLGTANQTQIKSEQLALKLLSIDGVAPDVETIVAGRYRLVRTLYHVTRPDAPAAVRDFIAFIGSEEAAGILTSTGNIAVATRP
jgi:phosphate transport system substrate-binding protein